MSEKPRSCMRNTAPTSDTGMAMSGTSAERTEPRKRKITMPTISTVSVRVTPTSLIALWM